MSNARSAKIWATSEEKLQRFADISFAMMKYILQHQGMLTLEIADLVREPAEYQTFSLMSAEPGDSEEARADRIRRINECARTSKQCADVQRCFPYLVHKFTHTSEAERAEFALLKQAARRAMRARTAVIDRIAAKKGYHVTKARFDRINASFRNAHEKRITAFAMGHRVSIVVGKGGYQRKGQRKPKDIK